MKRLRVPSAKKLRLLSEEKSKALKMYKEKLTEPVDFYSQICNGHYDLDTDVRKRRVSCVLLREQDDANTKAVAYRSMKLTDTVKPSTRHIFESVAAVWIVPLLHPFLER